MNAGHMIAEIRKYRGKTRQELADLLGISKQRMGQLEASSDVTFSTMQRVCAALEFELMAHPKESVTKKSANLILPDPDVDPESN